MRYAIIQDGAPVEVFPGQAFQAWLTVETPPVEEGGEPGSERQAFNVPQTWLDFFTPFEFEQFGVQIVPPTLPPAGERVVTSTLELDGDQVVEVATFEEIPPVVVSVPGKVSRLQAKMALAAAGSLAAVDAAVNAAAAGPGGEMALLYWNDASDFHRDHYLVQGITTGLGMSAEQVDALFISAASLAVM